VGTTPLDEQRAIVEAVAAVTTAVDFLSAEALHAIALPQERRFALVSAAVTGQIDVRGAA
jgi:type I restriction enzyme S subunit